MMDLKATAEQLESEEFYNLMQGYRFAPITDPHRTVVAFEAVKAFVRVVVQAAVDAQRQLDAAIARKRAGQEAAAGERKCCGLALLIAEAIEAGEVE